MFENYRVFKTMFAGRELTVETGKVCGLANGSCWVRYGETVVMVNVAASAKPRDGVDFFPLSVDYEEKLYAVGKIPGGFLKREGRPSEKAILTSRVVDRPMRPLFPKDMRNDVSVVCTVMSVSLKKSTRVTPLAVRRERFSMCKECAFALAVCATVSPILFYAVSPIYMQRFSEKDRTSSEYLCKRAAQHVKSTVKKNLLFFDDLVHHSRFVFFCIFIHGNDAGLHGARAKRELDDIVHLHIVGSAGNLAVDDDSTGVAGFVCHGAALDNAGNLQVFIQSHVQTPFLEYTEA